MPFGVTDDGFTLKRLPDILTDMQADLSTVVDPVTGETLTPNLADENDPLVQMVNSFADQMAEAWEVLQSAYNQFDPLKSTGAGLSGVVQLNGIDRQDGAATTVALALTGTPGTVIPAESKVSPLDNSVVFTIPEVTLDGGGAGAAIGTATEVGNLPAAAGTVVKIVTPVAGWTGVTNGADATPGSEEETDAELRLRQQDSTTLPASSIVESIYSGVIDLDGVTYCRVFQNIELATDSRGIPAKSIAPVVVGGVDADIGQVLFERVPTCSTFGTTTETITDVQGIDYDMKFTRPANVNVWVEVDVEIVDAALWTGDGAARIEAAILAFAATEYVPGTAVYASELYCPVNEVDGIKITSLTVGSVSPAVDDSVAIDWNEIAAFDSARIDVTVV